MESRIGMYFLYFLLIFSYISIAESGVNSPSDYKDYDFFTDQNSRTYNNGKDPNIRKNIEEMIKVMVQDSLPMAMETNQQKYDITTDMQGAVNEVILQIALHASKITQKIILQSALKPNSTQAIHTELQHCAMIENQNRKKDAKELADKVEELTKITKELTDTISLNNKQRNESSAILDKKITPSENETDLDFDFLSDFEFPTKNMTSLCDLKVPISLTTKHNSWKYKKTPEKDDLDIYMINKTGCLYTAVEHDKQFLMSPVFSFENLEWKLAVRTRQDADVALWWDEYGYSFLIGQKNNTVSSLREWSTKKIWEHSTPGLLSEDRYVPLYIKISNGKMIVGHECDSEPFITADMSSRMEMQINRFLKSSSPYGAKYLYNCPDGINKFHRPGY